MQGEDGQYYPIENPTLKKTQGCLRAFDVDMKRFKEITDDLESKDNEGKPLKVFIIDDLEKVLDSKNGDEFRWIPDEKR